MIKKCKCKKCVHAKYIITATSIPRVFCKKQKQEIFMPILCEEYTTEKESEKDKEGYKEIYSNGSIKILEVRGTSCGKAKTNN